MQLSYVLYKLPPLLSVSNYSSKEEVLSNKLVEVFALSQFAVVDLNWGTLTVELVVLAGEVALSEGMREVM